MVIAYKYVRLRDEQQAMPSEQLTIRAPCAKLRYGRFVDMDPARGGSIGCERKHDERTI